VKRLGNDLGQMRLMKQPEQEVHEEVKEEFKEESKDEYSNEEPLGPYHEISLYQKKANSQQPIAQLPIAQKRTAQTQAEQQEVKLPEHVPAQLQSQSQMQEQQLLFSDVAHNQIPQRKYAILGLVCNADATLIASHSASQTKSVCIWKIV
jgi:hypothetical protein